MCLFQSLSYLAAETTTATNMAVFTALTPLLTAAAAIVMLGEPAGNFDVIGGGLASAGVACAQAFRRPLTQRPG
jgi:drug/metabolite transporter (DMT)-like permease